MSSDNWVPTDDMLLAFEEGRLPEADIGAVSQWLETAAGAEERLRAIRQGVDPAVSAAREPCRDNEEIAKRWRVTERVSDRVAEQRQSNLDLQRTKTQLAFPSALRTIRDYQIVRELARGGMGQVFLARHTRLLRDVALKLLPAELAANREYRGRFERETAALGQMDHPNLVRAYDAGVDGADLFLVMELLDGQDLETLIRTHGPMGIADACEIIRQAALGLHYAHQHGMIHRDVKPSNLILTASGVVKVIDLGLARVLDPKLAERNFASQMTVVGTPLFMAPEQWTNTAVDGRADIYSLGCTLYCLLTGDPPFSAAGEDKTWVAMLEAHRHTPPPPVRERRPNIPAKLAELIDCLLAKDPNARPATAKEVAELLAPFAAGHQRTTAADSASATPQIPAPPCRTARERRAMTAAIRVGLLLSLAGACWIAVALIWPFLTAEKVQPRAGIAEATVPAPATTTQSTGPVALRPTRTLGPLQAGVMTVAYSPDGKVLATGGKEKSILLWDTATWTSRGPFGKYAGDVIAFSFSPDGSRLAAVTSSEDACAIRVWNVATGELAQALGGPAEGMWGVAYSPDGRTLACGGWDSALTLFDVATGEKRVIPNVTTRHVRGVSFSPDGSQIVTGGSGPTKLWDPATRQEIVPKEPLPADYCPAIMPPKGDLLAGWLFGAGRITVCAIPSGQVVATWRAHPDVIEGFAITPHGRFIASFGREGAVYIWSVADQTKVATLQGHNGTVYSAAFTPDGVHLATAGQDDFTIRIWDLPAICHVQK